MKITQVHVCVVLLLWIKQILGFLMEDGPLILTPYIEQGLIQEARIRSRVGYIPGVDQVSYAAHITVNKTYDSNMFFWFWPSQNNVTIDPVIVWLEGGPGGSSLIGMFNENGPYFANRNETVSKREATWNKNYSMLYIDNPIGTGYSYTESPEGYSRNQVDIGNNLYSCIYQFFQIFHELRQNDFYIAGSSYGGKFVTALGHTIHHKNKMADIKINLKGLIIGGGFCDPETMLPTFGEYLYNNGVLDENQRDYFQSKINKAVNDIRDRNFTQAYNNTHDIFNYYYLTVNVCQKALHVGKKPYVIFYTAMPAFTNLKEDFTDTVKPWLPELMENYKVLMYNGQYDMIVPVTATQAFLRTVPWSGLDRYKKAVRTVWKIQKDRPLSQYTLDDETVAGYVRRVNNFYQVIVQGAGHLTGFDQPERTFDMIHRFIQNHGFD